MAYFGTLPDQREVEFYELVSDQLTVRITNYGGRILAILKDGVNMLYGPETLEGILNDPGSYCGSICGRVANRIERGQFSLEGQSYQLAVNNGPNHLHGGICGFDSKVWTVQEVSQHKLVLTLHSHDGEENYPGALEVTASYSLEGASLLLHLEAAALDQPTIVNLTNHAYWNLNGNSQDTIDNHYLEVNATAYTPKNDVGIPDGRILPVAESVFDLLHPRRLGDCNSNQFPEVAGGYDHNYVLKQEPGMKVAAILTCPATGRKMTLSTDTPGLQVYTGDFLPNPRHGVALEPQTYPNAINIPHFPSVIVRPGKPAICNMLWTIE